MALTRRGQALLGFLSASLDCCLACSFIVTNFEVSYKTLMRANFYLQPRGPDVTNVDNTSLPGWTFLHNLLSVTGVRTTQPFVSENSRRAAVFNGEIYNHAALRASHCAGYGFTSNSDCETVLALWARHGTAVFGELRGMYAAALWDPDSREGVLIRDPFGIKPLYVAETAVGILFASEIAALRAAIGGSGEPDPVRRACLPSHPSKVW